MVQTKQDLPKNPQKGDYQFTHSPLGNEMHKERVKSNPELRNALKDDKTELFFKDLKWRLKNEKNIILVVYGETGSGKSTVAQRIAYEMLHFLPEKRRKNASLDDSHVCFSRTQVIDKIKEVNPGETIISDEDRQQSYGMGSHREKEQMDKIEQSVRAESLNFIFCSPFPHNHEQHYTIEAFDIDYENKVNRAILYNVNEMGMKEPIGTLYFKQYTIPGYIEKKRNYIRGVRTSMTSDRTRSYVDIAKELFKKYKDRGFPHRKNKKNEILFKMEYGEGQFTEEEIDQIITIAEMFKKGEMTPEEAVEDRKSVV